MTLLLRWATHALLLLCLPPLLLSVIARVKAFVAGRSGPPMLQPYRDLLRLLCKGAVYSQSTTWIFWMVITGVLGHRSSKPSSPVTRICMPL